VRDVTQSNSSVDRRTLLKGVLQTSAVLAAPSLFAGCAAGPAAPAAIEGAPGAVAGATTIITWIGGIASVIGAIPAAKEIAEWVRGDSRDQQVAREVRRQLAKENYTNESGAMVFRAQNMYFFAAATHDGLGGCAAFVRDGQFIQLVESIGAAALLSATKQAAHQHEDIGISHRHLDRMFLPVSPVSDRDQEGVLEHVRDVFAYKSHYGHVRFDRTHANRVTVSATAPRGGTWEFRTAVNPKLES
jgi:hypothetical protein